MRPKKLFTKRVLIFYLVPILSIGAFTYTTYSPITKPVETVTKENPQNTTPPVFVWVYEKDDSLNLDGVPQTNIFLEARYSNGVIKRRLIDTTPGSCNDIADSDGDSITTIQCYSAGLGYRFKVTKGETSYLVKRKIFEEALPNYTPPVYIYEVIGEFSLTQ